MAIKDLSSVEIQVVRSALEFMRKALERRRAAAQMDNHRAALGKDIEALDVVVSKFN